MSETPRVFAMEAMFGTGRDEMVAHVPHAACLGIKVVEMARCSTTLRLPWKEELIGDPVRGVVFGGVITTLLDQASGIAVQCALPEFMQIATLDLRIDYLRAAEPKQDLVAKAECYKLGNNVAFVRGSAWDRDEKDPFASMLATFMIVGPLQAGAWIKSVQAAEEAAGS